MEAPNPPQPAPQPARQPDAQGLSCLRAGLPLSPEAALALFDALEPVDPADLRGTWLGRSVATGHWLDGLLEACHWVGKRFDGPEDVHPLLFRAFDGTVVRVDPGRLPMALLRQPWVGQLAPLGGIFPWLVKLVGTRRSRARLRLTSHRGRSSATMIYDQLPIHDVFRRLDPDTVLGVMDLKGMERPFFFLLQKE